MDKENDKGTEKKEPQEKRIPRSPVVDSLKERFNDDIIAVEYVFGGHNVEVRAGRIRGICGYLRDESPVKFDYLCCITGLHNPEEDRAFEVVYNLHSIDRAEDINLKIRCGENEKIQSLFPVWRAADWFEREIYDMFGLEFEDHPNLKRILMTDDWEGFPLRKDYPLEGPSEESDDA